MREKLESTLGRVIGWGLVLTTLLVTPMWALDPINPIKMLVVVSVGFMCIGLLLANRKSVSWGKYKVVLGLVTTFILWQVLVIFFSGANLNRQLFGSQGRNTGFITYLAFSMIFISSMIAANSVLLKKLIFVVLVVGTASLVYGTIQALGADPINWVNPYSPVFGFLGNPNFQSSLLGVLGAIVFAQLFVKGLKLQFKTMIFAYFLVTLYVIKETASQQGFLVLAIGMAVVFGLYLANLNRNLGITYGIFLIIGFFAVLFGSLNKGPLASILFKESVTYRGWYWEAAWKMTLGHPLFGVGMDGYGEWYRRSRSEAAILRRGPEVTSDAAHNVYLDISSFGGFPLLIIYVALMALVVISAVKVLKRSTEFNPLFAGLFGAWLAFQAQSIISINQIGLAIWGWVFSGLIIGYEINTRNIVVVEQVKKKGRSAGIPEQASAGTVITMFIAFAVGLAVGAPPYLASAKFKSALESSDAKIVQDSAYMWPADPTRFAQVGFALNENRLDSQALQVTVDGTEKFPDVFFLWENLSKMNGASVEQKAQALSQMKRLDPNNPNLK